MTPSETEIEIRIAYLCNRAATGILTLDEESELLGYIALEPFVMRHIVPEDLINKYF